jgi:peptidyl-prolyl cis-trans isomerase C
MLLIKIIFISVFLSSIMGCEKFIPSQTKKSTPKKETKLQLPVEGTVIAKVNNLVITLEDLNQEIERYNTLVSETRPELKIDTRDKKIDYLKNELIRKLLLYQEALDRGLDSHRDVLRALEKTKQDLLVMQLIKEETEKIEVSSQEIENYYNLYKEQLKEPEERNIREIVVPTEAEARDILIQLLQGQDFATLARQYSRSPSAKEGGDLGFITKGKKFAQFDEVAFSDALDVGKVSNIFKGPDGYYIIKLEAKRGGKQRSLSEMWDDIKRVLTFLKQQQKIEELVSNLSRNARIEIYEAEIK